MTSSELQTIKESIERIEKFPVGYPKLITTNNPKWDAFFRSEYELCVARASDLLPDVQLTEATTAQRTLPLAPRLRFARVVVTEAW